MLKSDITMLSEAYFSIRKKSFEKAPEEEGDVSMQPNDVVSAGPIDEPAPGVDMDMESPSSMAMGDETPDSFKSAMALTPETDPRFSSEDETEEDNMAISNLHSIKESLVKIASACASGAHLEPWQQQKLAIAMDNLAEVARRMC